MSLLYIFAVTVVLATVNGHSLVKESNLREVRSTQTMLPISCTAEKNPVCGDNGQMYANRCLMEGAGVTEGVEGCNCSCPMDHEPVYGEDDKWYMNKCYMECVGVQMKTDEWFCASTYEWFPVCGIDGQTYGNPSSMACAGIDMAYPGKCECSCHKHGEAWVCGKNGFSYFNSCEMGCENIEMAYEGNCVYSPNGEWDMNGNSGNDNRRPLIA